LAALCRRIATFCLRALLLRAIGFRQRRRHATDSRGAGDGQSRPSVLRRHSNWPARARDRQRDVENRSRSGLPTASQENGKPQRNARGAWARVARPTNLRTPWRGWRSLGRAA
jgi:hypothetical protein